MNRTRSQLNNRSGMALLIVMFIVAMISVLSMSYAVKADRELSCGKNINIRVEADYLAQTALNYAKAHVVNPQDVTTGTDGYWVGGEGIQLTEGNDYFDITVQQSGTGNTPQCTYDITTSSYKLIDSERMYETNLQAQLRLDPFIVYWAGDTSSSTLPSNVTVYGDVYATGSLTCEGNIYGDVFGPAFSGNMTGNLYPKTTCNVSWPSIEEWRFEPDYYVDEVRCQINDWTGYSTMSGVTWTTTATNPKGYNYCGNTLTLEGDCTINGTLVVNGDITIKYGNFKITAEKNCPAIVATGRVNFRDSSTVEINGLVQAKEVRVHGDSNNVTINGGLFISNKGLEVDSGYTGTIVINGDPMKTSIHLMSTITNELEWSPVGDAYFKHIKRN